MEIYALQPTRLGRSPFCLLWPSSPAVCGASSSGKGVPSRQPCPPSPPPSLAPAGPLGPGLRTDTPLPNTEWEGPSCGSPARSPSQGTGSRAEGMAGAAEGPGPRHRGPGAAAGGGGWRPGGQGGSRGAPYPQLSLGMRLRSLGAGGAHSGKLPCPLALFLKGPDLLKEHAGLGRVDGRPQPWGQSAVPSLGQ